ncbi:MAG: FliH/SctL family protein [Bdellovibrionota bacterium]
MPWSKPDSHVPTPVSGVLKKDTAEERVLKHTPLTFEAGSMRVIQTYQTGQKAGSDFRMTDIVKEQTGVKKVEEQNIDEIVQVRLLEKLAEVQEAAYQEAYNLGLEEGTKKAFVEMTRQIEAGLDEFQQLIQKIHILRTDLFNSNERHIVELAFHMAKLLAQKEVSTDQAHIVKIMKSAVQMAQNEENVKVRIPTESFHFIQTLIEQKQKDVEFLSKMKVIPEDSLKSGDCIVDTNYGQVDSTMEQRAITLWNELEQVMPK